MSRLAAALLIVACLAAACAPPPPPRPEKPDGPLMDAPPYHQPLTDWANYHPVLMSRRRNTRWFRSEECLDCHQPRRFCQPCHRYIGVPAVEEP